MIEILTFTGVDSETDLSELSALAERYPKVEFGVLLGSSTGGIFPPLEVIEQLKRRASDANFRMALHLCGRYSRAVVDPESAGGPPHLRDICAGFGRVQVNLPGRWFRPGQVATSRERVAGFADSLDARRVILQHRGDWKDVPVRHEKVEYLHDRSGGRGRDSFAQWPKPSPCLPRMGYAGGLGPDNIARAVAFADAFPEASLWFDMESRIRKGGLLDLAAVESVCSQVFDQSGAAPTEG